MTEERGHLELVASRAPFRHRPGIVHARPPTPRPRHVAPAILTHGPYRRPRKPRGKRGRLKAFLLRHPGVKHSLKRAGGVAGAVGGLSLLAYHQARKSRAALHSLRELTRARDVVSAVHTPQRRPVSLRRLIRGYEHQIRYGSGTWGRKTYHEVRRSLGGGGSSLGILALKRDIHRRRKEALHKALRHAGRATHIARGAHWTGALGAIWSSIPAADSLADVRDRHRAARDLTPTQGYIRKHGVVRRVPR